MEGEAPQLKDLPGKSTQQQWKAGQWMPTDWQPQKGAGLEKGVEAGV